MWTLLGALIAAIFIQILARGIKGRDAIGLAVLAAILAIPCGIILSAALGYAALEPSLSGDAARLAELQQTEQGAVNATVFLFSFAGGAVIPALLVLLMKPAKLGQDPQTPAMPTPAPDISGRYTPVEPSVAAPVAVAMPDAKPLRAMHRRPKIPGFEPVIGNGAGEEMLDIEPVYGLVSGIEYQDANGEISRRRISFSAINAEGWIDAYCFERKAPRRFRIDRIRHFYDLDGAQYSPEEYFGMMQNADARLEITESMRPPVWESHWRDMLVLTAMARIDGIMEDSETAMILNVLDTVFDAEGLIIGPAEEKALIQRLRRMKPEPDVALRAAKGLSRKPIALRLHLISAAEKVMKADGISSAKEQTFYTELRQQLDIV